jgi:LPXTG-motif cell wall-anchored protein
MFKRRKRAPGAERNWAKRLSAMIAGIGGLAGGLLFWRKRKRNTG